MQRCLSGITVSAEHLRELPPGRHGSGSDRGGVLVITALSLVVLLGFAALVIDVSVLYLNRLILVNAVDAAALAGVQDLPDSPAQARSHATEYAVANGASRLAVTSTVQNENKEIHVFAFRDVDLYLARIFGYSSFRITAAATARVGNVSAYVGAVPFGVIKQDFVYGEQYELKYGPGIGEGQYHGNFGALALGGQGASNYENNVKYGYKGRLAVGDRVQTEPGNMAGPTARGVEFRIQACPHYPSCSWDTVKRDCPRLVVVPIIDSLGVEGRDWVEIVGFAAFFLEGTTNRGKDSLVIGRFIRTTVPGEIGPAGDYGLRSYKLVE